MVSRYPVRTINVTTANAIQSTVLNSRPMTGASVPLSLPPPDESGMGVIFEKTGVAGRDPVEVLVGAMD